MGWGLNVRPCKTCHLSSSKKCERAVTFRFIFFILHHCEGRGSRSSKSGLSASLVLRDFLRHNFVCAILCLIHSLLPLRTRTLLLTSTNNTDTPFSQYYESTVPIFWYVHEKCALFSFIFHFLFTSVHISFQWVLELFYSQYFFFLFTSPLPQTEKEILSRRTTWTLLEAAITIK